MAVHGAGSTQWLACCCSIGVGCTVRPAALLHLPAFHALVCKERKRMARGAKTLPQWLRPCTPERFHGHACTSSQHAPISIWPYGPAGLKGCSALNECLCVPRVAAHSGASSDACICASPARPAVCVCVTPASHSNAVADAHMCVVLTYCARCLHVRCCRGAADFVAGAHL